MAARDPAAQDPQGAARRRETCPICGKPADDRLKPFCSKRCADIDLHRWLSGVYAVPVVEDEERTEEEAGGDVGAAGGERH